MGRNYIFVVLMGILGTCVVPSANAKSLKIKRLFPLVSVEIPAEGGTENNEICPRYRNFLISHGKEMMDQLAKDPANAEALSTQVLTIGLEDTPVRKVRTQVNESTGVFKIEIENEPASGNMSVKRVITGELGKKEAKMSIVVNSGGHDEAVCRIIIRQNVEAEVVN